ncbi:MAG TPA: hypothetical protein VFS55_00595 [Dokdonella sp.]|nr:hypothetical protein [Dokdonella sp.]
MSATAETAAPAATKSTTLTALKSQGGQDIQNLPQVRVGFTDLQSFELAQRAAKCLAASTLVPQRYQNNIPNCVIALNMASRIGADPLMVMQNLYVVHGNPGWSSKFLIACFNECGRYSSVKYRMVGTRGKDDWGCIAYSKELATGELIEGPLITIDMAKKEGWYNKSGSKWQTIPEQMLRYRAAAWMINTTAPEIAMGIRTDDELHDIYDAQRGANGEFAVDLDALRKAEGAAAGGSDAQPADGGQAGAVDGADPQFDDVEAEKYLRGAASLKNLDERWKDVVSDYTATGRSMPVTLEAAKFDRRAALEQSAK